MTTKTPLNCTECGRPKTRWGLLCARDYMRKWRREHPEGYAREKLRISEYNRTHPAKTKRAKRKSKAFRLAMEGLSQIPLDKP